MYHVLWTTVKVPRIIFAAHKVDRNRSRAPPPIADFPTGAHSPLVPDMATPDAAVATTLRICGLVFWYLDPGSAYIGINGAHTSSRPAPSRWATRGRTHRSNSTLNPIHFLAAILPPSLTRNTRTFADTRPCSTPPDKGRRLEACDRGLSRSVKGRRK